MAPDPRCRLIQEATQRLLETAGKLTDEELRSFMERGLTHRNLLDLIGEISQTTLTNFTNRLAGTELDDFLKAAAPAKPD
jgi:alkylhydroperoxidase family enzyme